MDTGQNLLKGEFSYKSFSDGTIEKTSFGSRPTTVRGCMKIRAKVADSL